MNRLATYICTYQAKWSSGVHDLHTRPWCCYWWLAWGLAYATRLGKAMAGVANMCNLRGHNGICSQYNCESWLCCCSSSAAPS
ncbi:hypothetical protein Tsubulata_042912 [Turnera subulata]|uniref:Uncharacterized protein n=1 Tax=Turnera subulata TaxID=218843 RepID=A0A9Q0GM48_9ROSI|nr:hypothetical protein Tsubulata_042912 [Turnera subulata]